MSNRTVETEVKVQVWDDGAISVTREGPDGAESSTYGFPLLAISEATKKIHRAYYQPASLRREERMRDEES